MVSIAGLFEKVLIIDNDFSTREALTFVLEQEQFAVSACATAKCLDQLAYAAPAAIVLDIPYARYDRQEREILQSIRNTWKSARILLTSTDPAIDPRKYQCDAFLAKPFDVDVFVHTLAHLSCEKRNAQLPVTRVTAFSVAIFYTDNVR